MGAKTRPPALRIMQLDEALWVFGYGSLMWRPDFAYAEKAVARVENWQRRFCMWSLHYRGLPEAPGLVLALDRAPGAICDGVAFRVPPGAEAETLAALRARELITYAYEERLVEAHLPDGRVVEAVTYVIRHDHAQYAGTLPREEQAAIIAARAGQFGTNRDYLWNTAAHLAELGLSDPDVEWLAERVRALTGEGAGP